MIATIQGLRALAGDALIAIGEAVRGGSPNLDFEPGRLVELPEPPAAAPIPTTEIRAAFDELPDSDLLNIAAAIIAGWASVLLRRLGLVPNVDVLVDTLRDRAAQFRVVEDVRTSYPSTPPTSSSRRGE